MFMFNSHHIKNLLQWIKEVKCSSLTKFEISSGKKQEVSFKENEVKFDSLNNKKYCLL
jgi:hypothetical protein